MGKCKQNNCIYKAPLGNGGKERCCYYMVITGHSRGCPPDQCDKYKTVRRRRTKTSIEQEVAGDV